MNAINFFWNKKKDDGSGKNPLEVYNFGKAASFLFRPCQNADGSEDEVSFQRFWALYNFITMSLMAVSYFVQYYFASHRNVIFALWAMPCGNTCRNRKKNGRSLQRCYVLKPLVRFWLQSNLCNVHVPPMKGLKRVFYCLSCRIQRSEKLV